MRRKYKVNQNFFETIDTEAKAYFLGLMYSDGCISTGKRGAKKISISLQDQDIQILKDFLKALDANYPLYFHVRAKPHHRDTYQLMINSNKLFDDLNNLGCVERKSLIIKFPNEFQVPKNLLNHFIRGLFDGDGSITTGKKEDYHPTQQFAFFIYGTESICEGVRENIGKELKIENLTGLVKHGKIFRYSLTGNTQARKLFHYLYDNATIYLERKFVSFSEIHKLKDFGRKSVCKGVCFNKSQKRWTARKSIDRKRFVLGYFKTEQEAIDAVKKWELENADLIAENLIKLKFRQKKCSSPDVLLTV